MDVANHDFPLPPWRGERYTRARVRRLLAMLLLRVGALAGPLIRRGSADRLGRRARLVAGATEWYVAKRAALAAERKGLWMEARMLPALRRHLIPGVAVPRLLHVVETPDQCEIDLEWLAGFHSRVSLVRCIEGLDWLARLPAGAFADLPLLDVAALLAQTEADVREIAAHPRWQCHYPPPEVLLDRLRQHAFALAAFPVVVMHNDYRPGNILARGQTVALIDWAQATRGSILLDWMHLGVTRAEWLPAIWHELRRRVVGDAALAAALPHAAWFCAMVAACHTAAHDSQQPRGFAWFPRLILRVLLALEPPLAAH